jgi:hypothetical protein
MKSTSLTMPGAISVSSASGAPSAKTRERQGKFLIIAGSIVTLLGVVLYGTMLIMSDLHNEPVRYPTPGLIFIGAGLAVYLVGAFRYLGALLDLGQSDDDI